ncbi:cyclic nucleotide-binding domain-containing protein [Pontibacterium granulatum]|uniref:Crp/Fnr family transcriptional regulator n=1 Tax=Pontibacterium granulatum TaxID=2036029 RepID=UPI00249A1004|nr:cyclic nucleotide-binding domain-containing protein [Pontibacterium granulatum]MDI3325035.1 cyclic nucleotide-binding domain-containing protein [Pontibacterium granulatum]
MQILQGPEVLERFSIDYFRDASTFGALSDDTISWLFHQGRAYALDKGDVLFEPDERGDAFFVILQGSLAYFKCHDGKYAHIRNYQVGEQIGFMSMIALHNRVGSAVAHEDSIVLEVSNSLLHQLHEQAPEDFGLLMMNLAREMARTLRSVDNLVVDQVHERAETE